jgi:hypothetical protein
MVQKHFNLPGHLPTLTVLVGVFTALPFSLFSHQLERMQKLQMGSKARGCWPTRSTP